jgi:Tfp pilus assembly protein FimT
MTAAALADDLRLARSEAARLDDSVYFRVSGKGANACYVMYIGSKGDCDCAGGRAICKKPGSAVIKAEWLPATQPVRLSSNAETLQFQHRQGLVTQTGSIDLSIGSGQTIRQVVAITGRVRSCYVGASKMAGLAKCA